MNRTVMMVLATNLNALDPIVCGGAEEVGAFLLETLVLTRPSGPSSLEVTTRKKVRFLGLAGFVKIKKHFLCQIKSNLLICVEFYRLFFTGSFMDNLFVTVYIVLF